MAEAEVGLRASLKDRRETAAGLQALKGDVKGVGDQAAATGRQAATGARGFETLRRAGRLAAVATKAAFLGALAVGAGAIKFGVDAIAKASDLNETVSKSNVIFGANARAIRKWSTTAATSLGLSQQAALDGAASFGDMFSQIGFARDQSAGMSKQVVQMAADFGSFNNLPTDDVLERIAGGFRGEYDALQKLIPNISAARVQQVAMTQSGVTHAEQLTAQQKALATLTILQHDGARAMGDFQRTSGGLANQQKILGAQYDNISAKIGQKLLPAQLAVTSWINRKGLPLLDRFADWFTAKGSPAISDFADDMRPLATSVLPAAATAIQDIAGFLRSAAPKAKALVDAFAGMPSWAQKVLVGGGLAAVIGSKVRGGSNGGLLGGVGGLVSKGSPVPVFVTNQGFGGTGGPGGVTSKGKLATIAATVLGSELAAPIAAATAAIAGFFVFKKAADLGGVYQPNQAGHPQHAAGSNPAGTATLTAPKGTYGGFDNFNDMLRAQKLSSKYQFDFNTELQNTQNKLDLSKTKATLFGGVLQHVAKTKVDPPVTTPGLPKAQTGITALDTSLDKISQGATAHIKADAGNAWSVISALENYKFRDKFIQVHTVGGASGTDANVTAHGGTGRAGGGTVLPHHTYMVGERRPELFVPDRPGRILPRVDMPDVSMDDLDRADTRYLVPVNVHVGRHQILSAVVEAAEDQEARR